jgi:glycosyltransferase involved in cell wall biosynthesis
VDVDNKEVSIGMKRERLLQGAKGKYVAFIDDDDEITDAYIEDLREMIRGNYHVMRLYGQMSQYNFIHSIEMSLQTPMASSEDPPRFQRPPNHLNPMMADVAKFVHYKNAVHGEDLDWAITLLKNGFLSYEYRREPIQVHYIYNLGERTVHPDVIVQQRNMTYEKMLSLIFTPAGYALPTPNPQQEKRGFLRLGPKGFVSS